MHTHEQTPTNGNGTTSMSEILRQQSEQLRQLAEECKKREDYEAEMRANYPYFKRFVYDTLKERALREVPELPENVDLLAYAQAEGAVPFEVVIEEFERIMKDNTSNSLSDQTTGPSLSSDNPVLVDLGNGDPDSRLGDGS